MKAFKVELLIVDFDRLGGEEITAVIENTCYPNRCILPSVMKITERDIGEWSDDHPLNHTDKQQLEFERLFEQ